MEMVLNRTFADRVSLPWDRLLRAVLILLLVGALTSNIQVKSGVDPLACGCVDIEYTKICGEDGRRYRGCKSGGYKKRRMAS